MRNKIEDEYVCVVGDCNRLQETDSVTCDRSECIERYARSKASGTKEGISLLKYEISTLAFKQLRMKLPDEGVTLIIHDPNLPSGTGNMAVASSICKPYDPDRFAHRELFVEFIRRSMLADGMSSEDAAVELAEQLHKIVARMRVDETPDEEDEDEPEAGFPNDGTFVPIKGSKGHRCIDAQDNVPSDPNSDLDNIAYKLITNLHGKGLLLVVDGGKADSGFAVQVMGGIEAEAVDNLRRLSNSLPEVASQVQDMLKKYDQRKRAGVC